MQWKQQKKGGDLQEKIESINCAKYDMTMMCCVYNPANKSMRESGERKGNKSGV